MTKCTQWMSAYNNWMHTMTGCTQWLNAHMASSTAFGGNPLAIARKVDRCDAFGVFGDTFWRLNLFGIGKAKVCFLESGWETSEASYGSALDACFGC